MMLDLQHLKPWLLAQPPAGAGDWIGRSKADAPEVDAVVYVASKKALKPGDIVRTKITGADDYDLYGQTV